MEIRTAFDRNDAGRDGTLQQYTDVRACACAIVFRRCLSIRLKVPAERIALAENARHETTPFLTFYDVIGQSIDIPTLADNCGQLLFRLAVIVETAQISKLVGVRGQVEKLRWIRVARNILEIAAPNHEFRPRRGFAENFPENKIGRPGIFAV